MCRLCAAAVSLVLGRIDRWSGREIARSTLSLACSAQAERDNKSCFFSAHSHRHPSAQLREYKYGCTVPLWLSITKYMKIVFERFFSIAELHPNPLLSAAAYYEAPPPYHLIQKETTSHQSSHINIQRVSVQKQSNSIANSGARALATRPQRGRRRRGGKHLSHAESPVK
ncbi:hypothetical protein EVAR_48875_1 [Eumeta japonica]|uniref:Uncharacterized protein n=1 Tax=Eumeta variegata TaxID=151549 RepID=A0A4C1Y5Y0_EUMVA|nr:hypothetical protein EVAR_48875_1 [Eumeta japonica]